MWRHSWLILRLDWSFCEWWEDSWCKLLVYGWLCRQRILLRWDIFSLADVEGQIPRQDYSAAWQSWKQVDYTSVSISLFRLMFFADTDSTTKLLASMETWRCGHGSLMSSIIFHSQLSSKASSFVYMVASHQVLIPWIKSDNSTEFKKFHMKVQYVISSGLIQTTEMVGVYLGELVTLSDKI